jgi:hypothetical protein
LAKWGQELLYLMDAGWRAAAYFSGKWEDHTFSDEDETYLVLKT